MRAPSPPPQPLGAPLRYHSPSTPRPVGCATRFPAIVSRSEEHTSELQSQSNLVCRLLLEKKISCNILGHTNILIAVGVCIIILASLGSKHHTLTITRIVTQSLGVTLTRLSSVVSSRESVT